MRLLWLVLLLCLSCARPAPVSVHHSLAMKTWGPPTALVVVPASPPCLSWAVVEALKTLQPGTPVDLLISDGWDGSVPGMIAVHWQSPTERGFPSAVGLTSVHYTPKTLEVFAADTYVQACDVRLLTHELGHAFGLIDKDVPGDLMHWTYPEGGWQLTAAERLALKQRARP